MCIRDSDGAGIRADLDDVFTLFPRLAERRSQRAETLSGGCLLYTSDAADERSSVDLGGRRIIKKKNTEDTEGRSHIHNKQNNTNYISIMTQQ